MATYNDNAVVFGTQVITIGVTAYVAENASLTAPSTVIERRSEVGVPTGQVVIEGFGNGSVTLQHATTTTAVPAIGATFTLVRNDSTTIGCVVSEVGESQAQLDQKKTNVNFRRRYGS